MLACRLPEQGQEHRSEWLNSARGKTGDDFLPEVAKAVSKMMANRSDRRLPSLFMTETQRGRLSDEAKTRGFHQGQGHMQKAHQKAEYM